MDEKAADVNKDFQKKQGPKRLKGDSSKKEASGKGNTSSFTRGTYISYREVRKVDPLRIGIGRWKRS